MRFRVPILLWMMSAGLCSCAPAPSHQKAEKTVIGRPPPPAEDPFFVVTLPRRAQPAQSSGLIGELESKAEGLAPHGTDVKPPETSGLHKSAATDVLRPNPTNTEPVPHDDKGHKKNGFASSPPGLSGENSPPALPGVGRDTKDARTPGPTPKISSPSCFSCVKICPATETDCPNQDVVCGWGRAKRVATARSLALAECEASLEMVQEMPPWNGITGHCPTPTCSR